MSRVIKFRAWEPVNKKMHYMDLALHNGDRYASRADSVLRVRSMNLDALVVMQFTGLHDKNGKEIYEGDRLIREDKSEIWEVQWDGKSAGFVMVFEGSKQWLKADYQALYEIIGNIYENPNLVGG